MRFYPQRVQARESEQKLKSTRSEDVMPTVFIILTNLPAAFGCLLPDFRGIKVAIHLLYWLTNVEDVYVDDSKVPMPTFISDMHWWLQSQQRLSGSQHLGKRKLLSMRPGFLLLPERLPWSMKTQIPIRNETLLAWHESPTRFRYRHHLKQSVAQRNRKSPSLHLLDSWVERSSPLHITAISLLTNVPLFQLHLRNL